MGKFESHLNAVDSALQDFVDNYSTFLEDELNYQEHEIEQIKQVIAAEESKDPELEQLKDRLKGIESKQKKLDRFLNNDLGKNIDELVEEIKGTRKFMSRADSDIKSLEKRIDKLEGELMKEKNNKEFDLEKKLNKRDYKDDRKDIMSEIKKLRTSVHVLANELDKDDEIKIE